MNLNDKVNCILLIILNNHWRTWTLREHCANPLWFSPGEWALLELIDTGTAVVSAATMKQQKTRDDNKDTQTNISVKFVFGRKVA